MKISTWIVIFLRDFLWKDGEKWGRTHTSCTHKQGLHYGFAYLLLYIALSILLLGFIRLLFCIIFKICNLLILVKHMQRVLTVFGILGVQTSRYNWSLLLPTMLWTKIASLFYNFLYLVHHRLYLVHFLNVITKLFQEPIKTLA